MDAKLKALKVVDLRQILATASVSVPAKATKNDLITKIQSSKPALDAYAQLYPPDDLLAPPEEVDWNTEQPEAVAVPPPAPAQSTPALATTITKPPSTKPSASPVKPAVPVTNSTTATAEPSTAAQAQDPELEKRRLRAQRFGIPLVEQNQKNPKQPPQKTTGVSPEQLEARAKRFGTHTSDSKPNEKKRSAQTEDTDPEELERRKKRAERFGFPVKS